jgi:hypothetical protein
VRTSIAKVSGKDNIKREFISLHEAGSQWQEKDFLPEAEVRR